MTIAEPTTPTIARTLGARGSRSFVGSADPEADLTPSAAAVLAAIPAWWSARAAQAGLDGPWLDVHAAMAVTPPRVSGEALPLKRDWSPLSAEEVGAAYVEALAPSTRARHGRHYTPHVLASELWAMTKRGLGLKDPVAAIPGLIRDPACGSGALLLPALREHLAANREIDPQLVLNRLPSLIEGIDTDPAAVWVANVVFGAEMLTTLAQVPAHRRRPLPALARVGDGLAVQQEPARAVVLNPPYGRVRLSDADRDRFADTLYGHANLYGLFMAAAVESLADNGVMSALVPTSFTSGRYFEPLRRKLSSSARLGEVAFVEDRSGVFTSVLQETCLASFTRRRVRRTTVNSIGSATEYVATVATPTGGKPWVLPRRSDLALVAAGAAKFSSTLGDLGWRVSTGPLVWNRRKNDLYPRPGATRYPIVWAADLDGGVLHRDPARSAMRYLAVSSEGDARTMLLDAPGVLVQRTTAPEQARRLVAAELTKEFLARVGAVVVENHVNVIRPSVPEPSLGMELLVRILQSPTMDKVVRCISGSVALSAYELSTLPLPGSEVLQEWASLEGDELEAEIANAFRGVSS